MNKIINRITAVIVLLFIAGFLTMTLLREKGTDSYQENRRLAELPEFTLSSLTDGSCTEKLGSCFTDHFAGRSYWLCINGAISANLGESSVNGVYVADDMLLAMPEMDENSFDECISAVNDYAVNYNGIVYFVAVPSSSGVYSERLPQYFDSNSEKELIDSLYNSLESDIRKIDAYNILKMLNDNYIYYRSDSRWTSYGAYCVYRTVIQKLGFLPAAYDKYTIEHVTGDFRGNLYNISQYTGVKSDILDVYSYSGGAEITECVGYNNDGTFYEKKLYDKSYIGTNDMYKLYLGEDAPFVRIRTSVNNEKKLLVIKDDYGDCFIPFLLQHYSEIAVISPDYLENGVSSFINPDDYEQTLFLYGIENLNSSGIFENINK